MSVSGRGLAGRAAEGCRGPRGGLHGRRPRRRCRRGARDDVTWRPRHRLAADLPLPPALLDTRQRFVGAGDRQIQLYQG